MLARYISAVDIMSADNPKVPTSNHIVASFTVNPSTPLSSMTR
jgi:hypothetical protein